MSEANAKAPFFRSRPFGFGVLSGAGIFLAICGLGLLAFRSVVPAQDYHMEVVSQGAALNKAGGRMVQIRTTHARLVRQVCNEACDDLTFRTKTPVETTYYVDVLDQKEGCVECKTGLGVYGMGGSLARFDIREGASRLVEADYKER